MDELRTDRPEAGETILFCGHLEEETYHFFDKPEDTDPEGKPQLVQVSRKVSPRKREEFKIRFIILCDDCARQRSTGKGINPLSGTLFKAVWAPPDELAWSEHGKN